MADNKFDESLFEDVPYDQKLEESLFEDVPYDFKTEDPGMLETAAAKAVQGATFGFGDEAVGGLKALYDIATTDDELSDFGEVYERERDELRDWEKRAEEANPVTAFASEIAGGIVPALLTGGGSAVASIGKTGLKQAMKQAAKAGAIQGGISGLGYSEADDIGGIVKDAGLGVGSGALMGGALSGLGSLGKATKNKVINKGGITSKFARIFQDTALDTIDYDAPVDDFIKKQTLASGELSDSLKALGGNIGKKISNIYKDNPKISLGNYLDEATDIVNSSTMDSDSKRKILSELNDFTKSKFLTKNIPAKMGEPYYDSSIIPKKITPTLEKAKTVKTDKVLSEDAREFKNLLGLASKDKNITSPGLKQSYIKLLQDIQERIGRNLTPEENKSLKNLNSLYTQLKGSTDIISDDLLSSDTFTRKSAIRDLANLGDKIANEGPADIRKFNEFFEELNKIGTMTDDPEIKNLVNKLNPIKEKMKDISEQLDIKRLLDPSVEFQGLGFGVQGAARAALGGVSTFGAKTAQVAGKGVKNVVHPMMSIPENTFIKASKAATELIPGNKGKNISEKLAQMATDKPLQRAAIVHSLLQNPATRQPFKELMEMFGEKIGIVEEE